MATRLGEAFVQLSTRDDKLKSGLSQAQSEVTSAVMNMGRAFAASLGGFGISEVVSQLFEAGAKTETLNNAFKAMTGSIKGAKDELKFLRGEADRLGMNFMGVADSYKGIFAAASGTTVSADQVREIFSSVSEAAAVLGLSSDDTQGTLYALSQMLSKGKVSSEELRQQLGERLPGAFSLAAKAMGATTQELDKMLKSGDVMATDFLPKFAKALHEKYGGSVADSADSATKNLERFKNAWLDLKVSVAESGFMEDATAALVGFAGALKKIEESKILTSRDFYGLLSGKGLLGGLSSVAGKLLGEKISEKIEAPELKSHEPVVPEGYGDRLMDDILSLQTQVDALKRQRSDILARGAEAESDLTRKMNTELTKQKGLITDITNLQQRRTLLQEELSRVVYDEEGNLLELDPADASAIQAEITGIENALYGMADAAKIADQAMMDMEQRRLDTMLGTLQESAGKDGLLAGKETQKAITDILGEREKLELRLNDLARERSGIERQSLGVMTGEQWQENLVRMQEIGEQEVYVQGMLDQIKTDLNDIEKTRTAKIDADAEELYVKLNAITEQIWGIDQYQLSLHMDVSQAMAEINRVMSAIWNLQQMGGQNYMVSFYGEGSEVKPISEKVDDMIGMFSGMPKGANFKVDFLSSTGLPLSSALQAYEEYMKLDKIQQQMDKYKSMAYDINTDPLWASQYKGIYDSLSGQYQTQYSALAGVLASGYERQGYGGSGGGMSVNVSLGPTTIQYTGAGNARDDVITLVDRLDPEYARKITTGKALITEALRKAISSGG